MARSGVYREPGGRPGMSKDYLVILRCGRSSLHSHWLQGEAERNWDLVLCPFQDIEPEPAALMPPFYVQGQKWLGIAKLLTEWGGWRDYKYIWLPDDDLLTNGDEINRFFELSDEFNTKISAPALTEDSFYSHEISLRNSSFFARAVSFIEIMMPCLRRNVLELVLPTIEQSKTGYGWGMDIAWPRIIDYQGLVIFDTVAVSHLRPIGATRDTALVQQGEQEWADLLATYDASMLYKVLGAWDHQKQYRTADQLGFMKEYLDGYRFLIERHEHLLDAFIKWQNAVIPSETVLLPSGGARRNVALRKPAMVSSVSEWSRSQDPVLEAAGGNDGNIEGGYGFHTSFERDPWWQVDLQGVFSIKTIVVFNRLEHRQRCTNLNVCGSDDGEHWNIYASKLDGTVFGGADGTPYVFRFNPPMPARFVRIQMIGGGYLHLDEIEVYEDSDDAVALAPEPVPTLTEQSEPAASPRYHTSVVVCARWETEFIEEWLTYYQCIGYEHVYLYCNDDDPAALYEAVLPFLTGRSPFVTFVHFEGQGLQYAMYMHFIENYLDETRWVSFFDVDEFLRIADGSTIDRFLTRYDEDVDCILFNWRVFGTSGHKTNPPGKVLENYTKCARVINQYTKFIGRAELLRDGMLQIPNFGFGFWHSLHGKLFRPAKVVNVLGSTERSSGYEGEQAERIMEIAIIHHYLLRSEDAARLRVARGLKGEFSGQFMWDSSQPWVAEGLNLYNEAEDFGLVNFWKERIETSRATSARPSHGHNLLSRGKPCVQSSLSVWSQGATLAEDAGQAVNGQIDGTQKFHTEKEINPWWQIDLEQSCAVSRIVIYNAAFHTRDRLRNFKIFVCSNGDDWVEIHSKEDDLPVGSLLTGPFKLDLDPALAFRFMRIVMLGEDFLHLDQVEIYGDAVNA
jgi:hypothetical protein